MNICEQWRQEIKALLPCGFLRISRDAGFLFVSDYPLHTDDGAAVEKKLRSAGFLVTVQGKIASIDATEEKYIRAAQGMGDPPAVSPAQNPRLAYAARLMMESGDGECIPLARYVMRCCAMKDDAALEKVPEMLALQKRNKAPLSPLAGKILLEYLSKKEETTC